MAFLDNSGDIILDAVLTEAGRQRMARGNFRISQYAFGDIEIDYGLYNSNHPSGSAYFDLEILQSPVFEATSNSALPHELYTLNTNDILYAPSLQLNTKLLDAWQEYIWQQILRPIIDWPICWVTHTLLNRDNGKRSSLLNLVLILLI